MNTPDWSTYKFRCSMLPALMTNSRIKSEPLSETTKAQLREIYIQEVFGRRKYDSVNKYTKKGIENESDSLELVSKVIKQPLFKNIERLENEFLSGHPDLLKPLRDIKTSWDLWTFMAVDQKKAEADYRWQMDGYMMLTGADGAELIYALTDTPLDLVEGEIYRLKYLMPEDEADAYRNNFSFGDIPAEQRVKIFGIPLDLERQDEIKRRVPLWREYLASLS